MMDDFHSVKVGGDTPRRHSATCLPKSRETLAGLFDVLTMEHIIGCARVTDDNLKTNSH